MADYRITCVTETGSRITAVGIGNDAEAYEYAMTVDAVHAAILNGDTFHTVGAESGKRAEVETYVVIRTKGDSVTDNNLDSLPGCAGL